jgi:hypothetical protein
MWSNLIRLKVPKVPKYLKVKLVYSYTDFIKTELERPEWFRRSSGMREVGVLSSVLFSVVMDEITKKN